MGDASYIPETTKETLPNLNFSNKLLFTFSTQWNVFSCLAQFICYRKFGSQRLAESTAESYRTPPPKWVPCFSLTKDKIRSIRLNIHCPSLLKIFYDSLLAQWMNFCIFLIGDFADVICSCAQFAELQPYAVLNLMCLKGLHTGKKLLVFASSSQSRKSAFKHVRDKSCVAVARESLSCMADRRMVGNSKWVWEGERTPPASDLLALHALVFPLSRPFGQCRLSFPSPLDPCHAG